jgi:hypothetical protein
VSIGPPPRLRCVDPIPYCPVCRQITLKAGPNLRRCAAGHVSVLTWTGPSAWRLLPQDMNTIRPMASLPQAVAQ